MSTLLPMKEKLPRTCKQLRKEPIAEEVREFEDKKSDKWYRYFILKFKKSDEEPDSARVRRDKDRIAQMVNPGPPNQLKIMKRKLKKS